MKTVAMLPDRFNTPLRSSAGRKNDIRKGAPKTALISGITGQDGSYLAELLLEQGYEVHGIVRRTALEDPAHRMARIQHLLNRLHLHAGTLESFPSLYRIFLAVQPSECYHLAAQSFVSYSFDDEFSTMDSNFKGTHHILAALRDACPECRFYFAGTSEMFGKVEQSPQTENTRFYPRSAYGISKVAAFELTRNYRENYGIHASSGILFNHESPRRGYEFVTRKITTALGRIITGQQKRLELGNLDAMRDWGHARDYVKAMWLMLQQSVPGDYIIASGENHSVREFVDIAFRMAGLDYRDYVHVNPLFFRPADGQVLLGDYTKARIKLGWAPQTGFRELVREMVAADCAHLVGLERQTAARAGAPA